MKLALTGFGYFIAACVATAIAVVLIVAHALIVSGANLYREGDE